jgi:phosphoribosylformylglycinamidine synthase subunit PurL
VSLYNETDGKAILPTPVLGVVGVIDDASKVVTRTFKRAGTAVVLLGASRGELGGSEYLKTLHRLIRGSVPRLDLDGERRLQTLLVDLASTGHVLSAHDCAEGGLAVTLAECAFDTNGIGVEVDLPPAADLGEEWVVDATLFGETPSRVVVSTALARVDELLAAAKAVGVPAAVIGSTGGSRLVVRINGRPAVDVAVADAERIWATALERYFARQAA